MKEKLFRAGIGLFCCSFFVVLAVHWSKIELTLFLTSQIVAVIGLACYSIFGRFFDGSERGEQAP